MNPAKRTQAIITVLTRQRNGHENRAAELEAELVVLQDAYQELQAKVEDAQDAGTSSSPDGSEGNSESVPEPGA